MRDDKSEPVSVKKVRIDTELSTPSILIADRDGTGDSEKVGQAMRIKALAFL